MNVSPSEFNKCEDMNRQTDNQVPSKASTSQSQTSQEENLLQEDTQSPGSEICESSHLTGMSSPEMTEMPKESLGDLEEQKDNVKVFWEEERKCCLERIRLLSHDLHELELDLKRARASKAPLPYSSRVVWKKFRVALKHNLRIEDKCQELNVFLGIYSELKVDFEKQVQYLEELENNRKKIQALESEKIRLAQALETVTPKPSGWRRFILCSKRK